MKAIGLLKDDTDLDDMIQRSYRFFDDFPKSYSWGKLYFHQQRIEQQVRYTSALFVID